MRILAFTSSYGNTIGGGPVLAPLLMGALAARAHEVVVVTNGWPDPLAKEAIHDGVRVLYFPLRHALAGDVRLFAELRDRVAALKRELRPDVVYIFSSGRGEIFHHLTVSARQAPLMVTLHDLFPPARYAVDQMVGRNLRAASRITGCSQATIDWAIRHCPEIEPRASAILNAVPTPAPRQVQSAQDRRLLFPGRLVHKKGCDLAICAMKRLSERYPDLRLDIAGDGPEHAALRSLATELGVAERIYFLGTVERAQLLDLMAAAAIVLVPSRDEPFGLVALEAAHMGRPVIAGAAGGLPEVVSHGITGLVVPIDDVIGLAEAVALLLDDPSQADALGAAARQRAQLAFRWADFVDAYESLLLKVAAS